MSEGIILPGDLTPAAREAISGDKPMPAELRQSAAAAEHREIIAQIEAVMGTSLAPYKDEAPMCDAQTELQAIAQETDYNKVVQMPAWAHGRCIGAACGRWTETSNGPICGRALQDLAAGHAMGFVSAEQIDAKFAIWAYPEAAE
jgi:hypothetical protein